MKKLVKSLLRSAGYDLVRRDVSQTTSERTLREANPDFTDDEWATYSAVRPYTMTSLQRVIALIRAVKYICANNIPGDIVECGVWRGGSMMAVARTLMSYHQAHRKIYMYDTFEGMSEPSIDDVNYRQEPASELLELSERNGGRHVDSIWAFAGLDEVKRNVAMTGYPSDNCVFVKGRVEETIPATLPDSIAAVHLDTDWHESTKHELQNLYPRLAPHGILLLDDYGYWQGCKKAVDEFMSGLAEPIFLNRVDYTGRLIVKPTSLRL